MSGVAGMTKRAPMQGKQARQRMWDSMIALRRFTLADLVATGEVSYSHAKKYVGALKREGYVVCVRPVRSGVAGGDALWRLARDTGPYAPRIGARRLRDPNLEPTASEPCMTVRKSDYERALACVRACQGMADPEREVAALKAMVGAGYENKQ